MSRRRNRFYRKRHNRARVSLSLASSAGSAAWSAAGRRPQVEYADRALPLVNRN